jgi:hypothetical protein
MDHRNLQAIAHRLLLALKIAEANETASPRNEQEATSQAGVRVEALRRARGYVAELEAGLDEGKWRCERCGAWLPASVRSCGDCQRAVVAKAQERAG